MSWRVVALIIVIWLPVSFVFGVLLGKVIKGPTPGCPDSTETTP